MSAVDLVAYLANPAHGLPRRIGVQKAATAIVANLTDKTGTTFSLYFGFINLQPVYAVSIYPERGVSLPTENLTNSVLQSFVRANRALLSDPRNCVGVWFVKEENTVYVDVTTVLMDREVAVRLGKQYNQIGIYDFERAEVLDTDGTGTEVPNLPPLEARLPALEGDTS